MTDIVFMIYVLLQTPLSSLHFTTIIFVEEHNSNTCPKQFTYRNYQKLNLSYFYSMRKFKLFPREF